MSVNKNMAATYSLRGTVAQDVFIKKTDVIDEVLFITEVATTYLVSSFHGKKFKNIISEITNSLKNFGLIILAIILVVPCLAIYVLIAPPLSYALKRKSIKLASM